MLVFPGAPAGLLGHLDVADEVMAARDGLAGVLGTTFALLVPTAGVAALAQDAAVTVDGTDYVVRHKARLDDGQLTRVYLSEP